MSGRGEGVDPSAWPFLASPIDFFLKVSTDSSDSHGLPPVQVILISQISTYRTPSLRFSVTDREHRESAQESIPTLGVKIARSIRAESLLAEKENEMLRKRDFPTFSGSRVLHDRLRIAWVPETPLIRAFLSCVLETTVRRKPRPSLAVQIYPRLSVRGINALPSVSEIGRVVFRKPHFFT